ncbi:MAG: DMT family transporter [Clostridia bacterium]|nr:DMT family transporter [Clostridia bacterium]
MLPYVLVLSATLLFALQFLFNQSYQKQMGGTFSATLLFALHYSVAAALIMFAIGGFRMSFSWFSFGMAILGATFALSFSYFSIKAFSTVNLANYSAFSMLGGMLFPFLIGLIFYHEGMTVGKAFACVCIFAALLCGMERDKGLSKKSLFYYAGVFVLNGMVGVVAKIHQSSAQAIQTEHFMVTKFLIILCVCAILLLIREKKIRLLSPKPLLFATGFGVFTGLGNLFSFIALLSLPASVHSPIVTGGTMVFSFLVSLIRREKCSWRSLLSVLLAVTAGVLIIL